MDVGVRLAMESGELPVAVALGDPCLTGMKVAVMAKVKGVDEQVNRANGRTRRVEAR